MIAIVFGMIVFIQPFEIGIFEKDSIVAANISIKVDSYVWKYKKINGIMHKRLYNISTGKYVGDWIPV